MGEWKSGAGTRRWTQWREEDARAALAEHARSGQSLTQFARERRISLRRLMYWRKRLTARVPPFVAVAMPPARTPAGSCRIEIAVDEVTIRVREDLGAEDVARIAAALARCWRAGC